MNEAVNHSENTGSINTSHSREVSRLHIAGHALVIGALFALPASEFFYKNFHRSTPSPNTVLRRKHSLSGSVVSEQGKKLEGVQLRLTNLSDPNGQKLSCFSDDNGHFYFPPFLSSLLDPAHPPVAEMTAWKSGYTSAYASVPLTGDVKNIVFQLSELTGDPTVDPDNDKSAHEAFYAE